jgi:DNA-binding PadR family transcriptional regulator
MSSLSLGAFEELLLRALLSLEADAYGVRIRQILEEATSRQITLGAVYTTLDRLVDKGLVTTYLGSPTPQRGGRAKRFFEVTSEGRQALLEAEQVRDRLLPQLRLAGGLQ